jgi:hypothetical protein
MMKKLNHKFVETFPDELENGVIYISVEFASATHKCCCGCGNEVITPISPTGWKLIFDGKSVSLYPSIGNWSFKCQSHYWIENNRIVWAAKWSKKNILKRRKEELDIKQKYYKD